MKTKRYQSVFCLILISAFAHAETITFGGDAGWGHTISYGLQETNGWRNRVALTLMPLGRNPFAELHGDTNSIDVLLLAGLDDLEIFGGNYRIEGAYEISQEMGARTHQSIRPRQGGISLYPTRDALWAPGTQWENFTLEFFLRPSRLSDGDQFLYWEGRNTDARTQLFSITVERRRLVWEFRHFFRRGIDRSLVLTLVSPPLVPHELHHHRVIFTWHIDTLNPAAASPGYLEYLIDGLPVDAVHTTVTGQEGPEPFNPHIVSRSNQPIRIAPNFNGYFDELRLTAETLINPYVAKYVNQTQTAYGVGRTEVVDTGDPASELRVVRARYQTPSLAHISFFAQGFDNLATIDTLGFPDSNNPNWMAFSMEPMPQDSMGFGRWFHGELEQPVTGRYFVIGYVFKPDPSTDTAPSLSVVELSYESD